MGLDIYLISDGTEKCSCPTCGSTYEAKIEPHQVLGMTHTNSKMAKEAGLYEVFWHPEDINVVYAKDTVAHLELGLHVLKTNKTHIIEYQPAGGWGSYQDLLENTERYLKVCKEYPDYKIKVSI